MLVVASVTSLRHVGLVRPVVQVGARVLYAVLMALALARETVYGATETAHKIREIGGDVVTVDLRTVAERVELPVALVQIGRR